MRERGTSRGALRWRLLPFVAAAAALCAAPAVTLAAEKPTERAGEPRLSAFDGCTAFLRYVRTNAIRRVGPYGIPGMGVLVDGFGNRAVPAAEPVASEADGAGQAAPGVDYSTTNVQEAGVDEPDIVKTDGSTLYAVAGGQLRVVDVTGPEPRLVASLPLRPGSYGHQLLLAGSRLLVLAGGGGASVPIEGDAAASEAGSSVGRATPVVIGTIVQSFDVSDPANVRELETLELEGGFVSARLSAGTVRLVLASQPNGIEVVYPQDATRASLAVAKKHNARSINRSRLANWAPRFVVDRKRGADSRGRLVGCREIRRPQVFSGFGMLTVLTIDPARGVTPIDSDAVLGGGELVYASPQSLYVATQRWFDPTAAARVNEPPGTSTLVHKFDISSPAGATYRASGRVPGYLLNQFAMSEDDGVLRLASTDLPPWWGWQEGQESESFVTTLGEQDGKLVPLGQVRGLGKGERIYAVRFLGKAGYVVTFRQTDPLYAVDLADPANPQVRGELKILGYSAYLHPIGEGLLLGVGQDATEGGQLKGTQVSVFDVHDLTSPKRVQQLAFGEGTYSEAEWDHKAFLYWPATSLAVLPYTQYRYDETSGQSSYATGAVGVTAGSAGIAELGGIQHPDRAQIRRAIVVGDRVLTLSDAGVRQNDLATLAYEAWLPFA